MRPSRAARWARRRALAFTLLAATAACSGRARPAPAPDVEAEPATPVTASPADAPVVREVPPAPVAQPQPQPQPTPRSPVEVAAPDRAADVSRERARVLVARGERMAAEEVGYYMDVLEARLRQVAVTGLRVQRNGEVITLILPGALSFDVNSAQLSALGRDALGSIGRVLGDYKLTLIALQGHTDASGDAAGNLRLSEQRALSVSRELLTRGIAADRMVVTGFGASRPLVGNDTPEGREINRRVEIRLTPLTSR